MSPRPVLPRRILLHVHLEGSVQLKTLDALRAASGVILPFDLTTRAIVSWVRDGGWPAFLSAYRVISACFRSAGDYTAAVVSLAESLSRSRVAYAEVHFTPWSHLSRGVSWEELEYGLVAGAISAQRRHDVKVRFIFDLIRSPEEDAASIIAWMQALPRDILVGLGISGGPESRPFCHYAKLVDLARKAGLGVVAHAGELEGASSVRSAMDVLGVDRISHGVRALEDRTVLDEAIRRNVHFELCPTSNEVMGVGLRQYGSIVGLLRSGAWCSINTDDELLFDTTLSKEFLRLRRAAGVTEEDELRLQLEAARASFASTADKVSMIESSSALLCHDVVHEAALGA